MHARLAPPQDYGPSSRMTSPAVEDYLKAIYQLSRAGEAASTSAIADHLGIAAGSVTGMLKRLAEQGLVEHTRYYGARLTEQGTRTAVRTIRRHRVLEAFLVHILGYSWDRVHAEAEHLEHAASEELIDRMASVLGEPDADPHGAPIPNAAGEFVDIALPSLADLPIGAAGLLRQVPDDDPAELRYFAELGLVPGARVELIDRAPFNGPLRVRVAGTERVLGPEIAGKIQVQTPEP
jgi:DtxR family transcriptional regulator, Mn-dependent transcriptional regulator